VERWVGLYSVESAADSSADESTEVSGELLLTDSCRSIPKPMVYKAQPLESKILHQHNYQSHHRFYQSNPSNNNAFHRFLPCSCLRHAWRCRRPFYVFCVTMELHSWAIWSILKSVLCRGHRGLIWGRQWRPCCRWGAYCRNTSCWAVVSWRQEGDWVLGPEGP